MREGETERGEGGKRCIYIFKEECVHGGVEEEEEEEEGGVEEEGADSFVTGTIPFTFLRMFWSILVSTPDRRDVFSMATPLGCTSGPPGGCVGTPDTAEELVSISPSPGSSGELVGE